MTALEGAETPHQPGSVVRKSWAARALDRWSRRARYARPVLGCTTLFSQVRGGPWKRRQFLRCRPSRPHPPNNRLGMHCIDRVAVRQDSPAPSQRRLRHGKSEQSFPARKQQRPPSSTQRSEQEPAPSVRSERRAGNSADAAASRTLQSAIELITMSAASRDEPRPRSEPTPKPFRPASETVTHAARRLFGPYARFDD